MDSSGTPHDGEHASLQFEGRILTLNESAPGKVTLSAIQITASFDDNSQNLRYQVKDFMLQKINYKTVLAALKCTHPQIISAHFAQNQQNENTLKVKVTYEYLPEIVQTLVFEKKEIPAEESEQAMVRGMRTYIRGIRDQLNSLSCVQVIEGQLDQTTDTEVFVKLNHKKTVFTWALNLKNLSNNLMKMQFYYYSSITKQRKSTAAIPEEGVYVHHSGTAFLQIKFYAELEDFDMVIFQVQGKSKGEYTISSEKVEVFV